MTVLARSRSSSCALVAVACATLLLGACRADRVATTGSIYPTDYRARHPIVLADGVRSLDIFVTGTGHIDPRQAADIDAFIRAYNEKAQPFVWTKKRVRQKPFKGRRITQL